MKSKTWWLLALYQKDDIKEVLERLEVIRARSTHITQNYNDMPGSPTRENKSMDPSIEYVELEQEFAKQLNRFNRLKKERFDEAMKIKDKKVREVMLRRYVNCDPWRKIRRDMGLSDSHVYRLHQSYFTDSLA